MSSQSSSPYPILFASFNQDNSGFAISTKDGFKIFDSSTGRLCYERAVGAFNIVEMLYSSSLLAIVGAGEQPSLSPRCLCLFNTTTGNALRELNFLTSILAVRLNKKRLVVVLREKTYIYDANTLAILDTIDTVPNLKGLCAFSPSLDACYLALPASTTKGIVLVYNVTGLLSHCEIDAHRAPLAAVVLSSNGMYIATASEQGTIIRVFLVSEATKSYSFRRGTYPSTIYSLSFGPSTQLQDILLATSSSGSVHVFSLGFAINHSVEIMPELIAGPVKKGIRVDLSFSRQSTIGRKVEIVSEPEWRLGVLQRSRRSSSILGSILPESVNDVLDPAHHHVLHNAFPPGVKSYAVVRKTDRVPDTSSAEFLAIRASISIITYNGYFQEYTFSINRSESLWSLEREFNLLTVIADNNKSS